MRWGAAMVAWVLSSPAVAQTPRTRDSEVEVSGGESGSGADQGVVEVSGAPLHEARVARVLHPVRPQLLLDTHRATTRSMAGPRASPIHRDVVNDLHLHWRMVAEGYADPWTDPGLRDDALDLAVSGSWFGLSTAMLDRVARHPQLSVLVAAADTVARPELEIQDGVAQLGPGQPRMLHPGRAAWPSLEEPADTRDWRSPTGERPGQVFNSGLTVRLYETPDSSRSASPIPTTGGVGWVELSRHGTGTIRAEVVPKLWLWDRKAMPEEFTRWVLGVRRSLSRSLSVHANLRSAEPSGRPTWVKATVAYRLPVRGAWYVRVSSTRGLESLEQDTVGRFEVQLQSCPRWTLPQDLGRWPLGQEPGSRGPMGVQVPDRSPNELVDLVQTPAQLHTDAPASPRKMAR